MVLVSLMLCSHSLFAQALLQKVVRLSADNAPLSEVLKSIGRQGGFSFSYNSNAVAGKRPVTIHSAAITVEKALDELLKGTCHYKEVGNHIVLQASKEKYYQVSGYVLDAASGQGIPEASVYERQQLVAAVTNNDGFFRLRLRHQYPTADISISKYLYQDTTIYFASVEDRVYRLPVRAAVPHALDEVTFSGNPRRNLIDNFLSRLFLNNKLKAQTRNITRFIAERPVQTSFVPGLGTHGRLGAQVVNKFSLNVLGGYTAGVNGVEIGGLFNIDRGDVRFTQAAGLFNVVGGRMDGVQAAGLSNTVQNTVHGVQAAGLSNYAGRRVDGVQLSGISNVAVDSVTGAQIAGIVNVGRQVKGIQVGGIANLSKQITGVQVAGVSNLSKQITGVQVAGISNLSKQVAGVQVAGIANISTRRVNGIQVSGILNYTRRLEGVQVGLINLADSSDGISIGLLNLSKNGYHKLAVYSDEVVPLNAALKTGTPALYTILLGGYNPGERDKVVTMGAGLGHQAIFSKRWSFTAEATVQYLYLGNWNNARLLYRLRPSLCYQPTSWISFFTGPSINLYQNSTAPAALEYLNSPSAKGYSSFKVNDDHTGWLGWQIGLALF